MNKEEQRMWMSRSKEQGQVSCCKVQSFRLECGRVAQGLEHQGDEPQLSPQSYLLHVT